jgi:hypothetical protein
MGGLVISDSLKPSLSIVWNILYQRSEIGKLGLAQQIAPARKRLVNIYL